MSSIIPFDGGNLPAYLKNANVADLNADLTAHAGGGFPVISIKGKVFAVVREGERKIIPNPKDPDSPATSIEMVVIKANKGTSKVFYANGYQEGSENVKPDCFSNDGLRPDPSLEKPVCKSCATCPKNQWGSKVGDNGKTKGKACQDSVRIAVATPDLISDPYMLRVPPASIRALGEYGKMLAKRGVAYNMVVTKIGFDMESPTPLLTFKPVGLLPEAAYAEVQEVAQGDTVQSILGSVFAENGGTAAAEDEEDPTPAPVRTAKPAAPKIASKEKVVSEAEVVAAVAEATEPKAKKEVKVAEAAMEIDLDELSFDD